MILKIKGKRIQLTDTEAIKLKDMLKEHYNDYYPVNLVCPGCGRREPYRDYTPWVGYTPYDGYSSGVSDVDPNFFQGVMW